MADIKVRVGSNAVKVLSSLGGGGGTLGGLSDVDISGGVQMEWFSFIILLHQSGKQH